MGKKLIITAALCGAGTMKSQTPYVPVTPEEIAADAVAVVKAGASVIHI
ncbi:3-keto-5-aminohexanoate cleavage protein, partial [Intestinimonas butyriciproducens]